MQCGIQGPFFDQQLIGGDLLDPTRNAVTVARPPTEALQDENAQRSLQQVDRRPVHRGCIIYLSSYGSRGGALRCKLPTPNFQRPTSQLSTSSSQCTKQNAQLLWEV